METVVDAIAGRRGGPGTLTAPDADGSMRTVSWFEVHERARRLAAVLRGHGIGTGSRVGLLADTSIDLVSVLQGVWLAGAAVTVLPLPVHHAAEGAAYAAQLDRMVADARLHLVVVDTAATRQTGYGPLRTVGPILANRGPVYDLADLVARARSTAPATPASPAPDDLAILQYTSGSTRDPRGVAVTHANLAANLAGIRAATRHERWHGCSLTWLPLYHDMGLIGYLALQMSCGCPLVMQSPATFAARPASWLEAIAAYGATSTAAPNFAWALATRLLEARPAADPATQLGSLRFALSGGEPVDPAVVERLLAVGRRHGLDPAAVTCGYGLGEATLAVTFPPPGSGLRVDVVDPVALEHTGRASPARDTGRALIRVGRPVPGTDVRVVDRLSGAELTERHVGHVEVRGPGVVRGYFGEPPAPADRWLRTGDLGYLADGDLVICGREKDVLFAAGRNVFPQDVEAAAAQTRGVRPGGVVAFGVPGGEVGDRLVVAVESRYWADPETAGAIRSAVSGAVAAEVGLTPYAVLVLPPHRLCRTSSGKLRRAESRRQHLAGVLTTRPLLEARR